MDFTNLFKNCGGKKSRIGVIGATKGYGYTLLAQVPYVELMELRCICSRHPEECQAVLDELPYKDKTIVTCESIEDIKAAPEDAIIIVKDYHLVMETGVTSIVESTGNTAVSADAAQLALNRGINVYMVSKETDSVCGTALHQLAAANNAVYCLVNGDQPRNLIDLVSWAKTLGMEIIAAGKASEYDFSWNRETGKLLFTNGSSEPEDMPELIDCWRYEGPETLKKRRAHLDKYMDVISADLCEMNLVSNITGLVPAVPTLDYPICKASELADIFIPEEDGGILKKTGVVDVFNCLREEAEASFGGGEFIIVKVHNDSVWETLEGKGHVRGRNGKYGCIYWPYHIMGVETPISILLGDLLGIGTRTDCRQVSVLAGVAKEDLKARTELIVHGHHHEIDGLTPELLEAKTVGNLAPYYLLNGTKLLKDVKRGDPVTLEDVDLSQLPIYKLYLDGLALNK